MSKLDGKSKKELIAEIEELRERVSELTLFSESISHEIRTPLNSIVGFSGMLYKKETDDEKKEFLTHIINSGRSILSIMERLCPQAPKNSFTEDDTAPLKSKAPAAAASENYRILLAEDNPSNAKLITRLLKQYGYEVTLVENGLQAVEAVLKGNFDAVLMDIQMPVMNGKDACSAIRRAGSGIPIIALTACAVREEREACLAAGMNAFIIKPINIDEIEPLINRIIKKGASLPETSPRGGKLDYPPPAAENNSKGILMNEIQADSKAAQDVKDFDREKLDEIMGGVDEIMREAVDLLLEGADEDIDGLRKALEKKDAGLVNKLAHKMKGSALNACASRLASILSDMEKASAANDLEKASGLFETVGEAVDAFERAARKEGLY